MTRNVPEPPVTQHILDLTEIISTFVGAVETMGGEMQQLRSHTANTSAPAPSKGLVNDSDKGM
jgi:hypothetical protein